MNVESDSSRPATGTIKEILVWGAEHYKIVDMDLLAYTLYALKETTSGHQVQSGKLPDACDSWLSLGAASFPLELQGQLQALADQLPDPSVTGLENYGQQLITL